MSASPLLAWISGDGCQVSLFYCRASGSKFRISGFGQRTAWCSVVSRLQRFCVSDFGFQILGFGFRFFGFRVPSFGSQDRVSSFGFRRQDFGYQVSGVGFSVADRVVQRRLSLDGHDRTVHIRAKVHEFSRRIPLH